MALDKSNTKMWVKVVLIFLIVAFVVSFIGFSAGGFLGTGQQATTTVTPDSLAATNARYQGTVAAVTDQLRSEPTSYTLLVTLGNSYFDWALATQQASQQTTSAVGLDLPLWNSAKDAYARAIAVKAGEPPVETDYAITVFYTGQTDQAVAIVTKVIDTNPDFAPAWFNLGVFQAALGKKAEAIAAYERFLKLDPEGQQGNADFAKQQLQQLKQEANTATGSAPTTP